MRVNRDPILLARLPSLARMAGGIGDPAVRHRGTLGGSVANSDPAADYPAAVLALDAEIRTTNRTIPADDFFLGLFETALEPGELITAIAFRVPEQAAYAKFRNPASRYALAGVFVARFPDAIRVSVTGAGPCAFRWPEAEAALAAEFSEQAVAGLVLDRDDLNEDMQADAEYRAHLAGTMLRKALRLAHA